MGSEPDTDKDWVGLCWIHVGLCWIDDRCKVVCMKETVMAIASQLTQDPNTELLREKPRAFR